MIKLIVLILVFASVSTILVTAMDVNEFYAKVFGDYETYKGRTVLFSDIFSNNPDLLAKEVEYEKGISLILNIK
jgi:hypothetical protein